MKPFEYASALSAESAQQMVADQGQYLAGGNDLLSRLKDYLTDAKILVNVKSLPGLDKIETGSEHWTLGALVSIALEAASVCVESDRTAVSSSAIDSGVTRGVVSARVSGESNGWSNRAAA